MTFEPPDRPSANVTCGIDPPAAWGLWGFDGPLAFGQARYMTSAASDCRAAMADVGIPMYKRLYVSAIERPYGTKKGTKKGIANPQTLIVEAMSTGWWLRELRHKGLTQWCPPASVWRRYTGTKGHRKQAKAAAVALVQMICTMAGKELPRTKKGTPCVDACEALLIAFAAYVAHALVVKGDLAWQVIQRLGIPYNGKPAFIVDEDRIFNVRHTATLKEDHVLASIEEQVMAMYQEDDNDPWGQARSETEGEEEQRLGDSHHDDGEDRTQGGLLHGEGGEGADRGGGDPEG